MERIKLLDYQIKDINTRLSHSYDQIESALLDKYKAITITDLNSSDYEDIIEDIQDWNWELTSKYKG